MFVAPNIVSGLSVAAKMYPSSYLNLIATNSIKLGDMEDTTGEDLSIGMHRFDTYPVDGIIDEFMITDKALTQTEILTHYRNGRLEVRR